MIIKMERTCSNKIIEYKGKIFSTRKYCAEVTDLECEDIRNAFFEKPSMEIVDKNLISIKNGGVSTTHITRFYLKKIMSNVRLHHSKWSVLEAFLSNDLIRFFIGKSLDNKKVFPDKLTDLQRVETAIRLAGKGVAAKPTNFPMKQVDIILNKYNINNNYYDFSCGWGVRMLSSMKNKVNYFGTDPNSVLTEKLNEIKDRYNQANNTNCNIDIRTQGSEIFVKEWENKIGLAFSSPPYFNLEDYKIGNQSYKKNMNYVDWLDQYLRPTIKNIKKYLINNGILALNINDFDKFKLYSDTKRICLEEGFEFIEDLPLKNISRTNCKGSFNDNTEGIMIFKKIDVLNAVHEKESKK